MFCWELSATLRLTSEEKGSARGEGHAVLDRVTVRCTNAGHTG